MLDGGLLLLFTAIVLICGICIRHYELPPWQSIRALKNFLKGDQRASSSNTFDAVSRNNAPGFVFQALDENTQYDVVLMAGQSNMIGGGYTGELTKQQLSIPANIDIFDFSAVNHRFGPEISLAHELGRRFPKKHFVLIKYAVGGSSLLDWSPNWSIDSGALSVDPQMGPLYDKFLANVRQITVHKNVKFVGLIWMQGERDALIPSVAKDYCSNFRYFVTKLRADIGVPKLPVVYGQVNPPEEFYPYADQVRTAQQRAAVELENVQLVTTDRIPKWDDDLHFNSQGQLQLGEMFARTLMEMRE